MVIRLIIVAISGGLLLPACTSGHYKYPTASGNPASMSVDTLCYRYATRPSDEALRTEVARRGVDCERIIEDDPLYRGRGF